MISLISDQITGAIEVVSQERWRKPSGKVREALKAMGFTVKKSTGVCFLGEEQVLKCAVFREKREKNIIPTLFLGETHVCSRGHTYEWVVQPKVKPLTKSEFDRNWKYIEKKFKTFDLHAQNLCFFNGEIKALDW